MSSHVSRRGYARIGLPPCFFSFSSLSLSLEVIPLPMKRPMWQGTDASSPVHTWAPEAFQQPYLWVSLQEESFPRQSLDNWFFFFFFNDNSMRNLVPEDLVKPTWIPDKNWDTVYHFKPLCFGAICYTAADVCANFHVSSLHWVFLLNLFSIFSSSYFSVLACDVESYRSQNAFLSITIKPNHVSADIICMIEKSASLASL